MRLIEILVEKYPELLIKRYGELDLTVNSYEILEQLAAKRGMKIRGGEYDTLRAAESLLEEFRNCKIGKISLESV